MHSRQRKKDHEKDYQNSGRSCTLLNLHSVGIQKIDQNNNEMRYS